MKCEQHGHFWPHQTQRGGALLYALLVTLFMSFAFYGASVLVLDQNRETNSNANIMKSHLAIHSVIDYTLLGIKKRWCFDAAWMPEDTTKCNLAHPASVERIIMSDDAARVIQAMAASNQLKAALGTPLQLEAIERDIPLSGFGSTHPLRAITEPLKTLGTVAYVRVGIYRDLRASLPQQGREVYLKISTTLLDSSKKVITIGSSALQSTSYVGVYPRELSSFALLLPHTLYMDRASGAGLQKAENYFQNFSSRATALSYPGIVFESPVFVNADVVLPSAGDPSKDTTYTPVTFNDRVIIGSGRVRRGGSEYTTASPGAEADQLWVQNREFGGFVKGVDLDGSSDAGLRNLAGLAIAETPNADLMNICINRNRRLADLSSTKDSVLVGRLLSEDNNKYNYRLAFTEENRFNRQFVDNWDPNVNPWNGLFEKPDIYTEKRAVAQITAKVGNTKVTVTSYLGDEPGYIEFKPKVDVKKYIENVKKALDKKKSDLASAEKNRDTTNTDLTNKKKQLADAKKALAEEEAKPDLPAATPTPSPSPSVTPTPSPLPSATPSPTPTVTPTVTPQTSPTVTPTVTPIVTPTVMPGTSPTVTPSPSPSPSTGDDSTPTPTPTPDPNDYKDPAKITSLKADIATLEKQIADLEKAYSDLVIKIDKLQIEIANLEKELDSAEDLENVKPSIRVEVARFYINGKSNPTYRDFKFKFNYPLALRDDLGNLMDVQFTIKAYDVSYYNTRPMRGWWADTQQKNNTGVIKFTWNGTDLNGSPNLLDSNGVSRGNLPNDPLDLDLDALCSSDAADFSTAFDGADWSVSFAATSRTSWDFTFPKGQAFVFDENNASRVKKTADFYVKSIAPQCIIRSTADFVTGFYVCDELIIEKRDKPLRIIGTFIALKMNIHETVYVHGLRWSSIYNPMAVHELRDVGILKSVFNDVKCEDLDFPIWHPYPAQTDLANMFQCNPVSLRYKADPFTWTAVDPDCGLVSDGKATTCKNRLLNFIVVEVSRDAGI